LVFQALAYFLYCKKSGIDLYFPWLTTVKHSDDTKKMKTTAIYIRLSEAGQPVALTTMDIKVLLLRAGGITIKELAEDKDMKCSRVALSRTVNGSLQYPEVRKKLAAKLEKLAAQVAQQKTKLKVS
jgi:hypothetical protein